MRPQEQDSVRQFDAWAQHYDQVYGRLSFVRANRALVRLVDPPEGVSILDVGCGTGILLDELARLDRDLSLCGVDISPEMVKTARSKLGDRAEILIDSAAHLPYGEVSFDMVTCSTSFHHYPDSRQALSEIYRVLKPGGRFFLLDPFTTGVLRKAICWTLNLIFREKDTHLYTRDTMCRLFQEVGFTHIQQQTYTYYKLLTIGIKSNG